MGLDCSGSVVAGLMLFRKELPKVKTKYNEDTGKPYTVTVNEEVFTLLDSITLSKADVRDTYEEHIFYQEDGYCILGVEVASTDSNRIPSGDFAVNLTDNTIEKKKKEASELIKELFHLDTEVDLFLLNRISY